MTEDTPFLSRLDRTLTDTPPAVLLILKGHLVIEEALNAAVARKLPHPEHLKKARLSFYQLVHVAKTMFDLTAPNTILDREVAEVWDAMLALNKIRNELAHQVSPEDLDLSKELRRLFSVVGPVDPKPLNDPSMLAPINQSIGFLLGFCSHLREGSSGHRTSSVPLPVA